VDTDDNDSPSSTTISNFTTDSNFTTSKTLAPTSVPSTNDTLDIFPSDVDTVGVDLANESEQAEAVEGTPPSGSPPTTAVLTIAGLGGMLTALLFLR